MVKLINKFQNIEKLKNLKTKSVKKSRNDDLETSKNDGIIYQEMNANFKQYFQEFFMNQNDDEIDQTELLREKEWSSMKEVLTDLWEVEKSQEILRKVSVLTERDSKAIVIQNSFEDFKFRKNK